MGWEAKSTAATLGPGSRLCVLETPQIEGLAPAILPSGVDMPIEFFGRGIVKARVLRASGGLAVIQTAPDGRCWRMTHLIQGEPGSGITTSGMHSSDWVIRAEIECPT